MQMYMYLYIFKYIYIYYYVLYIYIYVHLTDLDFFKRSAKFVKNPLNFDYLKTITQEENMETKQRAYFFLSSNF